MGTERRERIMEPGIQRQLIKILTDLTHEIREIRKHIEKEEERNNEGDK